MIEGAHRAIREGDAYQLCVTTQLGLEGTVDPVALHRVMRSVSPTHHQALIRLGEITLVSASPETFLDISPQGKVVTKPIKGTRPRGATREEDVRLAEELVSSEKERAENLMIVDLMRNDLSKVCEVGSIHVPELCVLETYSSVHQLVSTVTGQLAPGADLWDVIEASFPAGSMTGAPKIRAMEVLAKTESGPRGYYSGIYGVWRVDGSATLGMTIRTAIVSRNSLSLGVGGGITALSDPDDEIREVGIKAAAFLQALGVSQGDYS
jgi:anthranilate synthase component 1